MNSPNFYVYEHIRLDTNMPFYIGKGNGDRATMIYRRNNHWKNIFNKAGGRKVKYLIKNIDEELALLCEIEAIDVYRKRGINLVNMTNGGDGVSGHKPIFTDEWRTNMSKSAKGKTKSLEHKEKIGKSLKNRVITKEHREKIANTLKGRPNLALKGKPRSEEVKLKVSNSLKAYYANK